MLVSGVKGVGRATHSGHYASQHIDGLVEHVTYLWPVFPPEFIYSPSTSPLATSLFIVLKKSFMCIILQLAVWCLEPFGGKHIINLVNK